MSLNDSHLNEDPSVHVHFLLLARVFPHNLCKNSWIFTFYDMFK